MVYNGVTSVSVMPMDTPVRVAGNDWINDFLELGNTIPNGKINLRTNILANADGSFPQDLFDRYKRTIQHYYNSGSTQGPTDFVALLGHEFRPDIGAPGRITDSWYPGSNNLLNPYIDDFSNRAAEFVRQMWPYCTKFIIWNEPNFGNTYIPPDRFAALLYQCNHRMKAIHPTIKVYMGGLIWEGWHTTNYNELTTSGVTNYLSSVYSHLVTYGGGRPWDALNTHIHHYGFQHHDIADLKSRMRTAAGNQGDDIIVGEWGLDSSEFSRDNLLAAYTPLRDCFDFIWYFEHGYCPTAWGCPGPAGVYWGTMSNLGYGDNRPDYVGDPDPNKYLPGPASPIRAALKEAFTYPYSNTAACL
jgi:hypothetical protein